MRFEHASVYLLFILWTRSTADVLVQADDSRLKGQERGLFDHPDRGNKWNNAAQGDDRRERRKFAFENQKRNNQVQGDVKLDETNNRPRPNPVGADTINFQQNLKRDDIARAANKDSVYPTKAVLGVGVRQKSPDSVNGHIPDDEVSRRKQGRNGAIPNQPKVEIDIKQRLFDGEAQRDILPHLDLHQDTRQGYQKDIPKDTQQDVKKVTQKGTNRNIRSGSQNEIQSDTLKDTQKNIHIDTRQGSHIDTNHDTHKNMQADAQNAEVRNQNKNDNQIDPRPKNPKPAGNALNGNIPPVNTGNDASNAGKRQQNDLEKGPVDQPSQEDLRRQQQINERRVAIQTRLEREKYQQEQEEQARRLELARKRQDTTNSRVLEEQRKQEDFLRKQKEEQQQLKNVNEAGQVADRGQERRGHQAEESQGQDRGLERSKNDNVNLDLGGGGGRVIEDGTAVRVDAVDRHREEIRRTEPARGQGELVDINPGQPDQSLRDPRAGEQQEQQQKQGTGGQVASIGQADVKWDGDDFALVFGDNVYMEQKIRRASVPTVGAPWPKPQYMKQRKARVYQIPPSFQFKISDKTCDIIEMALKRYRKMILKYSLQDMHDNLEFAKGSDFEPENLKYNFPPYNNASTLDLMSVRIRTPCSKLYPSETMDESYTLVVKKTRMYIASNEVWGALRGLETFSQLVFKGTDDLLYIREVLVNDYPRFAHRGVLIDTSRHFIFKEVLYDVLEGMAQNKLNVMHWHIVDDQSFPFESKAFPKLSKKGAFRSDMVYSKKDVADIIEYARFRGIRVVPEFDTPGHTYSWGLGYPDLLTQCYSGPYPINGYLGPINPASNYTYDFLKSFFKEVLTVFKDKYVHLGGDEVPLSCWVSNPSILAFSEKIGSYGDTRKLMEYYETKLLKIIEDLADKKRTGVRTVVWQDVIDTVDQLPARVVIHVWKGGMPDVQRATSMGHHVLYSSCWYLDLIEYGSRWYKYYLCDPTDGSSGYIDEKMVLGGEAALWAEYIDNENLMTTLWPRASATAERLWSHKDQRDVQEAGRRLVEHRCRMLGRGLGVAQISGPDYCPSRGPREPISAGRLMDMEDKETTEVPEAPKKKILQNSMIEVGQIDLRIGAAAGRPGPKGADCGGWATGNSVIPQGNGWVLLFLTLIILAAVVFQVRSNSNGYSTHRILRNKTILFSFLTLLVIYITCYTTIWLQVLDVKRSFLRVQDLPVEPNNGNVFRS